MYLTALLESTLDYGGQFVRVDCEGVTFYGRVSAHGSLEGEMFGLTEYSSGETVYIAKSAVRFLQIVDELDIPYVEGVG